MKFFFSRKKIFNTFLAIFKNLNIILYIYLHQNYKLIIFKIYNIYKISFYINIYLIEI